MPGLCSAPQIHWHLAPIILAHPSCHVYVLLRACTCIVIQRSLQMLNLCRNVLLPRKGPQKYPPPGRFRYASCRADEMRV